MQSFFCDYIGFLALFFNASAGSLGTVDVEGQGIRCVISSDLLSAFLKYDVLTSEAIDIDRYFLQCADSEPSGEGMCLIIFRRIDSIGEGAVGGPDRRGIFLGDLLSAQGIGPTKL